MITFILLCLKFRLLLWLDDVNMEEVLVGRHDKYLKLSITATRFYSLKYPWLKFTAYYSVYALSYSLGYSEVVKTMKVSTGYQFYKEVRYFDIFPPENALVMDDQDMVMHIHERDTRPDYAVRCHF